MAIIFPDKQVASTRTTSILTDTSGAVETLGHSSLGASSTNSQVKLSCGARYQKFSYSIVLIAWRTTMNFRDTATWYGATFADRQPFLVEAYPQWPIYYAI